MSKDINWLKEQMNMPFTSIGERFTEGHKAAFNYLVSQVEQPELPVIPQYVAEWVEENKGGINLRGVFSIFDDEKDPRYDQKVDDWLYYIDDLGKPVWNDVVLARAWIDGYIVEEKKYAVTDNSGDSALCKVNGKVMTVGKVWAIGYEKERIIYELTEQEIKDYDERYIPFMIPVDEVDSE